MNAPDAHDYRRACREKDRMNDAAGGIRETAGRLYPFRLFTGFEASLYRFRPTAGVEP